MLVTACRPFFRRNYFHVYEHGLSRGRDILFYICRAHREDDGLLFVPAPPSYARPTIISTVGCRRRFHDFSLPFSVDKKGALYRRGRRHTIESTGLSSHDFILT